MSIFGDETITLSGSPDDSGQDEGGAAQAGNEGAAESNEFEHEDEHEEEGGAERDEEVADDEDEDPSPDDSGQDGDGLILGKFKSQEDLAKAYLNLQREFTKSRQGGGQQQQPPEQQQLAPQGGQQQDQNQAFWQAFKDNPMGTIQALVQHAASQQVAPLIEERQTETLGRHFDGLAKEYRQLTTEEGMQQFATAIREVASELGNPALAANPTPRVLRMAAQEAFGDSKAKAYQKGKEAGRQESEQTRQNKQGLGAKGGARPAKGGDPTPEQSIIEGILAAGKGGGGIFG